MAGGSGTRLWPSSRAAHPKQFLKLHGHKTMLQATIKRLDGLAIESSVTICGEEHRFFVAEQLREIDKLGCIILEPVSRNTAPAIALAAFSLKDGEDPLLLVLAADHVILDEVSFNDTILSAIPYAEAGKLVTFGIIPSAPNTGYGYIKKGLIEPPGFAVEAFVEKPSAALAKAYFESGNYLWNSGMFLVKASRYLEELKKYRPDIFEACKLAMQYTNEDNDFLRVNEAAFYACPSESIDYAVMEKTDDAFVIPMDAGWSDIGSWLSLWEISVKDQNGNATHGDVLLQETNNCYVRADDKLVTTVGVDDLIIIDTKDALLVAHRDRVENIKSIAQKLREEQRTEWENHREVYRPWGKYDSIDRGDRYRVKRITVKPGAKLSVQMHHHRAEHWVVVSGTAKVTNGEKTFILLENQSTYIPLGTVHALENPGTEDLELIEVQSGDYLEEDDIVRFEDRYGRKINSL